MENIMRHLATIQTVSEVLPIEGAEFIEKIRVRDWWCVSKKGEFSTGDACVYFEIDSLLPSSNPVFSFLAAGSREVTIPVEGGGTASGYRLKTVKLRGQISQGLALRQAAFGLDAEIGTDVSSDIGVILWEPPLSKQVAAIARGPFPCFIPKTDEERVQNLRSEIAVRAGEQCYVTEKLDGTSATFYRLGEFHACSRNLDTREGNLYWDAAEKYGLVSGLPEGFAVQGEVIGEGIQGNPLKRKGQEFYAFNVYDIKAGMGLEFSALCKFCKNLNISMVPVVQVGPLGSDVTAIIAMADGDSLLTPGRPREGLVFRTMERDRLSFKVISNRYLLKEK